MPWFEAVANPPSTEGTCNPTNRLSMLEYGLVGDSMYAVSKLLKGGYIRDSKGSNVGGY